MVASPSMSRAIIRIKGGEVISVMSDTPLDVLIDDEDLDAVDSMEADMPDDFDDLWEGIDL